MKIATLFAALALVACSGKKQLDEPRITPDTLVQNKNVDCPPPLPAPNKGLEQLRVDVLDYFKEGYCLNIVVGYSGCGKVKTSIVQDPGSPTQITFWAENPGECDGYFQDTLKLNLPDKSRSVYYNKTEIRP